jgi:hypothetical protein
VPARECKQAGTQRRKPGSPPDAPRRSALNAFHAPRRISRLSKPCGQQILKDTDRFPGDTVFIMALIQNHHDVFKIDNVVRLNQRAGDAVPGAVIRTPTERVWRRIQRLLWRQWTRVTQWSAARRERGGFFMAERARQRRELERLSDRELRDIGITRYEIEFVLRQSADVERRG